MLYIHKTSICGVAVSKPRVCVCSWEYHVRVWDEAGQRGARAEGSTAASQVVPGSPQCSQAGGWKVRLDCQASQHTQTGSRTWVLYLYLRCILYALCHLCWILRLHTFVKCILGEKWCIIRDKEVLCKGQLSNLGFNLDEVPVIRFFLNISSHYWVMFL